METGPNFDTSYKSFIYWFRWILVAVFVGYLIYSFQAKKQKKLDLKTRLWRRFVFTNSELFNYLDDDEKVEMFKVYDTTVKNAALFQNAKAIKNAELTQRTKKKTKRVSFQL